MTDKPQVFLIHFAGGNCYSFQAITRLLNEFEVYTPELPGRGRRANEILLKDFDTAALDIFKQCTSKLTASPFLLYGHSMGAFLALKVSHMLEQEGIDPAYLIVSGNAGPGIRDLENNKKRYLMDHDELIEELKNLGGIPDELFNNRELFDFFEPVLRADFEVSEKEDNLPGTVVKSPLYAMMGNREKKIEKITNWSKFTSSTFGYEILEGDHFFINKHPNRIAAIIKDCYKKAGSASPYVK